MKMSRDRGTVFVAVFTVLLAAHSNAWGQKKRRPVDTGAGSAVLERGLKLYDN